jgi:hypothetical protein
VRAGASHYRPQVRQGGSSGLVSEPS